MCILANELSICVLICACRHVYCTCAVSCIVDRVGVVAACLGTLRDGGWLQGALNQQSPSELATGMKATASHSAQSLTAGMR